MLAATHVRITYHISSARHYAVPIVKGGESATEEGAESIQRGGDRRKRGSENNDFYEAMDVGK